MVVMIMMLLVLLLVRTSLIDEWQTQLPADAPNHFMLNIGPESAQPIEDLLSDEGITSEAFYPMIRGRIMSVNGEELLSTEDVEEQRRQRETNFTWSNGLPKDNLLVAGQWWPSGTAQAAVAFEDSFA